MADLLKRLVCSRRAALSRVEISRNSTGSVLAKAQAQSSRTLSSNRLNMMYSGQTAPILREVKQTFDTDEVVDVGSLYKRNPVFRKGLPCIRNYA
jgi:hypothetical protein